MSGATFAASSSLQVRSRFATFDLNPGDRYQTDVSAALDLAEYFPGGGTDFERPLGAALDVLADSRFRKGDIVFVTDGQAQIGEAWREGFLAEKKRLGLPPSTRF